MASPTGSINPLPTQPLAYYDDQGNNGTITFALTPSPQVSITAAGLSISPATYSVSAGGNKYTGSNTTSSLELTVESGTLCYGVITITSSGAVVNFGAKLCEWPGGWLLLNGSQTNTILITQTLVTVTLNGSTTPYPVTAFSVGSSITFTAGTTISGTLSTPTTGQVTINGTNYTITHGSMLPSPASGSWQFTVEEVQVGTIKVDISSQLWLTRTAGNKLFGPLFLPIDSTTGVISSAPMDGRMHIGAHFYNAMSGNLNPTTGGGGTISGPDEGPTGQDDTWTAEGSGK
jgi:hypothetical protein